jgi:DNA polymerase elongation subunit (family B)
MGRRPNVYGLDIETDTTVNGLDSEVAPVVTVALSLDDYDEVFSGDEPTILTQLDRRLAELKSGVLATWNGAAFDLPFLADRAALLDLPIGLRLRQDPGIRMQHQPLPGHPGAYRARWYRHGHIDAYRLYRGDVGPALRVSCSLKSIARLVGLAPLQVDRRHIHDLSREVVHAYAASDARLARVLTERRWGTAARFVDRFAAPDRVDLAS